MIIFLVGISSVGVSQKTKNEDVEKFNRFYEESNFYFGMGVADSAQMYLDSAYEVSGNLAEPFYQGMIYSMQSRVKIVHGNLDSARFYNERAIDIYAHYPDSIHYFISVFNLGGIYLQMDDHIQGLVQFKKVIRIIDENFESLMEVNAERVTLNRAYSYASIGLVYKTLHDYENALTNYEKAIKVSYRIDSEESKRIRAITLGNIGETYFLKGDFELAESYAVAGLELKNDLGLQATIGYNYQILAMAAYGRGKYRLCNRYLEEADEIFESNGNQKEIARSNFWRAKILYQTGKYAKAEEDLLNLEPIYKKGFSQSDQADLYDLMSEVFAAQKKYKVANEYLLISRLIRKDVDLRNDKKMVGEFLSFFEEEENRLNDRIQSLKNQQEREKLELKIAGEEEKRVWVYSLFGVSTLCLILIIIIIAKAYKRNKKINQKLSSTIHEKQLLFKEVHHRVKNNFQIISSLLNLQQGIEENERGRKVLSDAQGRIQSMSLVHELLYQKNEVKSINFRSYTNELVSSIVHSFSSEGTNIDYSIKCDVESFDLEVAIPLGLILNEAITNSVKYAFKDRADGKIIIELKSLENHNYELIIKDNGIGIPEEYIDGSTGTLGVELINILSEQIGGNAKFRNDNGATIRIIFKGV